MSRPTGAAADVPSTADLRPVVETVLIGRLGERVRVVSLDRRPSDYRSSWALEELDVRLESGVEVRLVFKNLGAGALLEEAANARPSFLVDAMREIETYRWGLARTDLGTASFYGAEVDPRRDRYWLFLERVTGPSLWQVGELSAWCEAAAWLGGFHAASARTGIPPALRARLIRHDRRFYRLWLDRAVAFARRPGRSPAGARRLGWLAERYDRVVDRLVALPATLIHGELYPSNVLVATDARRRRVCAVDWETAGLGSGLVDLAALTAGAWREADRSAIAESYRAALRRAGGAALAPDDFAAALDLCRLHLAVQLLGWSPDWTAPPAHANDWLAEAMRLAEALAL